VTIEDLSGSEVYSESTTTDLRGNFWIDLRGSFDLVAGQVVTVSDGDTTKTHQVLDLVITDVDAATDVVSGTAEPFTTVEVQTHGAEPAWRSVSVDASGNWSADFSTLIGGGQGIVDLQLSSPLSAYQSDDDGDITWADWIVPAFTVDPDSNSMWGWQWSPNVLLTVAVDDDGDLGNGVLYETSAEANRWGDFNLSIFDFDLVTGQVVTITDGTWTKVHIVTAVNVTEIDTAGDTVSGTAEPNAAVRVEAGLFANFSSRDVQADGAGNWTADFSVPAQGQPPLDITDATTVNAQEFDDDGDATSRRAGPPVQQNRGVAVTPGDNHVWVANSGVGTVTRLDNDGTIVKVIETGNEPTGVAVDAGGNVWVTNLGSNNAVRIDPTGGSDGLGAVDLTVDLGDGASPYNYSDMTGAVVVGSTSPQGIWAVVQDSGEAGFEWGRITWNTEPEASEPAGTEIVVEARTADSEASLGGEQFLPVTNGEPFSSFGRFIEVRVTLKASPEGLSPVLSDIRVQPAIIEVDVDIKPGSDTNPVNLRSKGVIPVAILTTDDFDAATVDPLSVEFGPAGATEAHNRGHLEDVDGDGDVDLVLHFRTQSTGIQVGDTEACLTGETYEGRAIQGCDNITVTGAKK
jgi:hypothetical protein